MLMYVLYYQTQTNIIATLLLCFLKPYKRVRRKGKRDMKSFIKDLLIIAVMMIGLIGVSLLILFDPPIPAFFEIGIIVLIGAYTLKEGYDVWRKEN